MTPALNKTGLLLMNLGSPDAPTPEALRRYLDQFLMDKHVIQAPWLIRRLIVSLFILPTRPPKSAEAYQSIWRAGEAYGAPLIAESMAFCDALQAHWPGPLALGMRYGNPSIEAAVESLLQQGAEHILIAPLYPQHATSTRTTSIEVAETALAGRRPHTVLAPFYADDGYLQCLVGSLQRTLPAQFDHLLLSYHGLPEAHLKAADASKSHCLQSADCCEKPAPCHAVCYRHQSRATSKAVFEALGLDESQVTTSYQSRLGRLPWLQPYTDQTIVALARSGVKHLVVASPAFVADNLETLEELGIQGKEAFLEAGGEQFTLLPCLNAETAWVRQFADLCARQLQPT